MDLQKKLCKEKEFTTGNGKKMNVSFIPALAVQFYQDYASKSIKLAPEIIKQQKKMQDPDFRRKIAEVAGYVDEFNKEAEEIKEKADEVNDIGMEIITIILESNDQDFEVTEKEILKRMSLDDMNRFIVECCTASKNEKKK